MIIYNDFDELDCLAYLNDLSKTYFIVNNFKPSKYTVTKLNNVCKKAYYCIKLYNEDWLNEIQFAIDIGFKYIAIDAENYKDNLIYNENTGELIKEACRIFDEVILLPENLGSDKYNGYDDFIKGLEPDAILMERSYLEWRPWMLYKFYKRNNWYNNIYIGVWQDNLWPVFKQIQMIFARLISKNKIFWYSEKKLLP